MADIQQPADLASVVRGLESRIRALETAPRLENSTLPWSSASIDDTFTTASTTAVDSTPTAGPTITIDVGQNGRVLVTATTYIGLQTTSQTGSVDLFVDGAYRLNILALSNSASAIASNVSSSRVITGLSIGSHTFTLKYRASTGDVNFSSRSLIVQPF